MAGVDLTADQASPPSTAQVCVLSIMYGPMYTQRLGQALLRNKRAFCAACGYRCMLWSNYTAGRHDRTPHWDKLAALHDLVSESSSCALTMWVDADVVLYRPFALLPLMQPGAPIAAALDSYGFNSGVMLFSRSREAARFLRIAWRQPELRNTVWEQSALRRTLQLSPELRSQVTLYENLVQYPPLIHISDAVKRNRSLRRTAPVYHIAGCFLLSLKKTEVCSRWLLRNLARVDAGPKQGGYRKLWLGQARCDPMPPSIVLPRPVSMQDTMIPPEQGFGNGQRCARSWVDRDNRSAPCQVYTLTDPGVDWSGGTAGLLPANGKSVDGSCVAKCCTKGTCREEFARSLAVKRTAPTPAQPKRRVFYG
tara:strand:- start:130 stop:1227 length:1098 start_codon:yes stop_codon:yes gene_type:complete